MDTYTPVQYTVTFVADGATVKTMTVEDGYVLQSSDYPAVPERNGYTGRWNGYTSAIHENITITAIYSLIIPSPEPIVPGIPSEPVSVETAALSNRDGQLLVSTQTVQHDYITQNGKVVRESITTDGTVTAVMDFIYDESGKPFALIYTNGTATPDTYYYVLNLQGDVVGLVNSSGGWVAQYTYNAWGEIITSSGTMADINPLRYRGYYYDTETGFYYLQSRYYDPVTHRFINADGYASTGQSVLGTNMFAYCLNCPIVLVDLSGTVPSPSAMLYQGDSCNITYYSTGDAISIAVSDNFIYIDAHMTFSGYIDTTILVAGIKEYWEGQYLIDGKTKTVVVNIYEGSSSNGYTVTVKSFYGNGTSNTICAEDIWHTTKESRIEIFSRYKSGHPKNIGWSMAHEFGHSLGVKDYYTHVKAKEFGFHKNYLSIFNRAGMHATSVDIGKVLSAFESNSHQDWRWYD